MNKEQEDALTTAYSYLNKLFQAFDEIIENFKDSPGKYGQTLADGLDGVKWLAEILAVTQELHNYSPDEDFIKEQFSVILGGMENEDYAFVAEVIENELMPLLGEWFDIIEEALEENSEKE